jgi:hypothetical protein
MVRNLDLRIEIEEENTREMMKERGKEEKDEVPQSNWKELPERI